MEWNTEFYGIHSGGGLISGIKNSHMNTISIVYVFGWSMELIPLKVDVKDNVVLLVINEFHLFIDKRED